MIKKSGRRRQRRRRWISAVRDEREAARWCGSSSLKRKENCASKLKIYLLIEKFNVGHLSQFINLANS